MGQVPADRRGAALWISVQLSSVLLRGKDFVPSPLFARLCVQSVAPLSTHRAHFFPHLVSTVDAIKG